MDGTTQAGRNAKELVEARLIMRRALDRHGGSWDEHPLSAWPEAIQVCLETGRPVFLYGDERELRSYELGPSRPIPWKAEPAPTLIEGVLTDELVEFTGYSEGGEVIGHEVSIRSEP